MVKAEVKGAREVSRNIPVAEGLDRVTVSDEVGEHIDRVKAKRDIDQAVQKNMIEIQKALNFRKTSIVLMNSNYSKVLVRKIEPIKIQEARTIMDYH